MRGSWRNSTSWSDIRGGFEAIYSKDQLLTNVMIYLVTRTFNTATWMYRGLFEDFGGAPDGAGKGRASKSPSRSPTSRSISSRSLTPRSMVEKKHMNVAQWTRTSPRKADISRLLELRPDDRLVADIRKFARTM